MKILLATDDSAFSRTAIEKCCQVVVRPENTAIKVVSVYQAVVPIDAFATSAQYSEMLEKAERKIAEDAVTKAATAIKTCFPASGIDVTTTTLIGAPDQAIIKLAEEWGADLIVVGPHGRGFWGRMMLGSVSDSIVHHAPCSVLIARAKAN
jgi:nucleotide-binding universal stress UspA family protein